MAEGRWSSPELKFLFKVILAHLWIIQFCRSDFAAKISIRKVNVP